MRSNDITGARAATKKAGTLLVCVVETRDATGRGESKLKRKGIRGEQVKEKGNLRCATDRMNVFCVVG